VIGNNDCVHTIAHISIVPTLMALILTVFIFFPLPLPPGIHCLDQIIRTRMIPTAGHSIPEVKNLEKLEVIPTRRKEVQAQEVASPRKRIKRKYAGMSSKIVRPYSKVTRLLEEDPTFKMISNARIFRKEPEIKHEIMTNNIRKKVRMKNKRTRYPEEGRKSRTRLRQFDISKDVRNISQLYSNDELAKPFTQTRDDRKSDEGEETVWNTNNDMSEDEEDKHSKEERNNQVMSVITLLD
jgi:hypothetical protein